MSQHYLGLHIIQLVFHFCLYIPCDTKCRTFLRMAQYYIYKESIIFSNIVILLFFAHQSYQRNRKYLLFLPVKQMFEKSIKQVWLFIYLPRSLPSYFKYNRYCSFVPLFLFLFLFFVLFNPLNGQTDSTIRRLLPTDYLSVFDHFAGLARKGLKTSEKLCISKLWFKFSSIFKFKLSNISYQCCCLFQQLCAFTNLVVTFFSKYCPWILRMLL